jgi:SprT-like family protein
VSHRTLKKLYREYNRRYFGGRLPDALVAFVTPAEMKRSGLGKATCAVTCLNKKRPPAIYISRNKFKTWGYIRADLLHEMCHVSKPRANHGKVFQDEMLRIAKLGAMNDVW